MSPRSRRRRAVGAEPLLEIADLRTWFFTRDGVVRAVDGVSFQVAPGETLAIVGESGCGKSVTALSILRLIPSPPGRIVSGTIRFAGRDLRALSEAEMRDVRGNEISMIFQEPMTSLNPVLTIGRQIAETLTLHQGLDRRAALAKAVDMLRLVHIPEARAAHRRIPAPALGRHAPAGDDRDGARLQPEAADRRRADDGTRRDDPGADPRSDARVEAEDRRRDRTDHPRSRASSPRWRSASSSCMPAGRPRRRRSRQLFRRPLHPYTKGLLASVPRLGASLEVEQAPRLAEIPGTVPSLREPIAGCPFEARCAFATDICRREMPAFEEKEPGHFAACFHSDQVARRDRRTLLGPRASDPHAGRGRGPDGDARRCCRSAGWSSTSRFGRGCCSAPSARCTRSTASPSTSPRARPWASSARAAAASRPPARRSSS